MGSVWRRLGTKVTVIEFLDHIVPGTDKDVGKTFLRLLKKQGMKFKLKTAVQSAEVAEEGVALARSASEAPDVDGLVRIEGGEALEPGDFTWVEVVDADEHDLHAMLLS